MSYVRLFPFLPAFTGDQAFLHALGLAGGACDGGDEHGDRDSDAEVAAGWPIFGQLIAHDITADRSALQARADVDLLQNARVPRLDLESLYGDGPAGHPFLFQRNDTAKFLLGPGGADLLRNAEGIAVIPDLRDDSNVLISQLHLALQKVHNAFVDRLRASGVAESLLFEQAARQTRWSYQWIVLHEFLPELVGQVVVDQILEKPIDGRDPRLPLEFAAAAYRYGHSQIRHRYAINGRGVPVALFPDLLGFRPVPPERRVDWTLFFDLNGQNTAQRAKRIDGKLVRSLITLPTEITGTCEVDAYRSLAVRDLQRGQSVGLPSGEAIARHLDVEPLTVEEVGLNARVWRGETPLWFYVLREAGVRAGGHRLGPVGGQIVADVLVGLLRSDPQSFLNAPVPWQPAADAGRGGIAELLTWAE